MNINIYLENDLAKSLNKFVKSLGHSRNAIIREAIRDWVLQHEVKKWSHAIMTHKGIKTATPFESHRSDLLPPDEDPLR